MSYSRGATYVWDDNEFVHVWGEADPYSNTGWGLTPYGIEKAGVRINVREFERVVRRYIKANPEVLEGLK